MSRLREWWRLFTFEDLNRRALGLVSLVVLGFLVLGTTVVTASGMLEDRVEMSGTFADVSGLRTGSTVRVAGVDVGTVTSIAPNFDEGTVHVTWRIERYVELHPEVSARLAAETLFGGQQIRLVLPGGAVDSTFETAGHHVALERTSRAVDVVQAIDTAAQTVEQVDLDLVNQVSVVLAELAEANRGQLDGLFDNLQKAASALGGREEQLGHLLDNAQVVSRTLTDRDQQIFQLLDGASNLLDELSRREAQIRALLGDGTDAVADLGEFVRTHRRQIENIVTDLGIVVGSVQGDLDNLSRTLAYLGPAFGALPRTRGSGDWIDFLLTGFGDPGGGA